MYRYTPWTALRELGFWIAGLAIVVPVYILVTLSFKSTEEAASSPALSLPKRLDFSNYRGAWSGGDNGGVSFGHALVNSVVTTTSVIVLLIALGGPAGYMLARRTSRLSSGIFWVFVAGMVIPGTLGLLPLFVFLRTIGLIGTRLGLILVYVGIFMPYSVFLYTGFVRGLPTDYEEAALVDGASRLRVFVQVVLPLLRPVSGTVAILCGLFTWNDFFRALIFVGGTGNVTLPVAIQSFVGQYATEWNLIFAGIVIALAPVLLFYLVSQRYVIRGFASGVRG